MRSTNWPAHSKPFSPPAVCRWSVAPKTATEHRNRTGRDETAVATQRSVEAEIKPGQPTEFSCPRCPDAQLTHAELDGVAVETCRECGGIFLDLGEVPELLGAISRSNRDISARASSFDNFALGLYMGLRIRSRE